MRRLVFVVLVLFACVGCDSIAGLRQEQSELPDAVESKAAAEPNTQFSTGGIWISKAELATRPTSGSAWRRLKDQADRNPGIPNLSDQNQMNNVYVLAKALVYARTGQASYRTEVRAQCMAAIGTESDGRTLALGRELVAYVIAADLVGLEPSEDLRFRAWLRTCLSENLGGQTLRSTHEKRPNNWGTHAGASRAAVAAYLGDRLELERTAKVFRGWLGDRAAYSSFAYGSLAWQSNPSRPVGINNRGASKEGHSIDGVLPDDQRRGGDFIWPPPKENYVYEALQGAVVQAVILSRAGYDVWNWSDKALLRAYEWLANQAEFPAAGDDTWQMPLIEYYYRAEIWSGGSVRCGKNMGWTDWTHG